MQIGALGPRRPHLPGRPVPGPLHVDLTVDRHRCRGARVIDDCGAIHPRRAHGLLPATWLGIAAITDHVDSVTVRALEVDSVCRTSLSDLITELCFNSIKQGQATRIDIYASLRDARTVALTVRDNGLLADSATGTGPGARPSGRAPAARVGVFHRRQWYFGNVWLAFAKLSGRSPAP